MLRSVALTLCKNILNVVEPPVSVESLACPAIKTELSSLVMIALAMAILVGSAVPPLAIPP